MTPKPKLAKEIATEIVRGPNFHTAEEWIEIWTKALEAYGEDIRGMDHMPDGPCCVALDRARKEALEKAHEILSMVSCDYEGVGIALAKIEELISKNEKC